MQVNFVIVVIGVGRYYLPEPRGVAKPTEFCAFDQNNEFLIWVIKILVFA